MRDSKSLPVEIWQRGGTWTFHYGSDSRLDSVIVDPDRQLPDVSLENNGWGGALNSGAQDQPVGKSHIAVAGDGRVLRASGR